MVGLARCPRYARLLQDSELCGHRAYEHIVAVAGCHIPQATASRQEVSYSVPDPYSYTLDVNDHISVQQHPTIYLYQNPCRTLALAKSSLALIAFSIPYVSHSSPPVSSECSRYIRSISGGKALKAGKHAYFNRLQHVIRRESLRAWEIDYRQQGLGYRSIRPNAIRIPAEET